MVVSPGARHWHVIKLFGVVNVDPGAFSDVTSRLLGESFLGTAMSTNTMTRADLAEAVHREIGLPRQESGELVEAVLDMISDTLVDGKQVKLSSFGSFVLRDKNGRVGRNPKTGEEVPIDPRRVLVFKPSQVLKERIDQALSKD